MAKVLNCATTPVDKAYKYTQEQCDAEGKMLSDYFSDFYENYLMLQEKCDLALDLPRIEMPVIEPEQMDEFEESLDRGHIDVNEPIATSPETGEKAKYPTDLGFDLRGRAWLFKGLRDGARSDDIIQADMTEIAVADLKPTQSQIWLEKVVGMSLYFGPLKQSSKFLHEAPIIVSSDGYILDGHHRFGAAMVSNPSLRLTALKVDMPIDELVKMARSYGNAIGNEQKAAETFEAEYNVPKPEVMPSFMGWYAKQPKKWQRDDMKRRLDGIWREGDKDEVSIKHIYYSLGALGAGRDWHTQTDYGFEMNKIDMVQRMWWPIQAIRDEIGLDNFKELVLSIPNYGEAFEQFEFTLPDGKVIKGDGWSDYKSESFEAEMDKVVDVDCVNIVSKKSAFTGKDRNFYRVSFRDASQYDRFGIPAWASRAAETMGTKYYGVSGCKMVMGMLPSGKWQIQAILIPNTQKMNKQKALKIANHMQDRIEKEGQWAKKKCRENEIIEIYQAEEYGAETSNFVNPRELVDEEKGEYGIMYLRGAPNGQVAKFLHLDCPLNQNLEDIGTSPYFADEGEIHFYEPESPIGECYTCGKNVKLSDEDFDFMTSWYEDYDAESYEAERIQYNYVVHRHPKGSSKGGWFKSKKAETFGADDESLPACCTPTEMTDYNRPFWREDGYTDEDVVWLWNRQKSVIQKVMKKYNTDPNICMFPIYEGDWDYDYIFGNYYAINREGELVEPLSIADDVGDKVLGKVPKALMDEIYNARLLEWGQYDETFYDAETFSTKPAYGLFGLSFITGLFVNFARKR